MKILIAVDGSRHSRITLRLGAKIARIMESPVTVLTIARTRFARRECDAFLLEVDEWFSKESIPIETKVRTGKPVRQIVQEATEGEYGLVILGFREAPSTLKRIFGPTVDQVVTRAPCPVLIAKEDKGDLNHVLICDSGAEGPSLMNRFIRQMRELVTAGLQVSVLHVMSQMSAGPGVPGWELRANAEELMKAHTPEGELLEQDTHVLETSNIHPRVVLRHGFVVDEIIAEARLGNYGLIAIGAHRREGWQSYLLDDLAHQIIVQADRPVLVLK